MSQRVGVVGSREGADVEQLEEFLEALYEKYPDTLLVSGGNHSTGRSIDFCAEQKWLALGGEVWSFRPVAIIPDLEFGIEKWELGGSAPRVYLLLNEPTWANYKSAAIYRDMLIAETCDRLVVFYRRGRSPGASLTAELAGNWMKPVHTYEPQE